MNNTHTQSAVQHGSHRSFLAGLALGAFLVLPAALQLALSGYARLDPQSHWPLAVLLSNAANLIRLYFQPSSLSVGIYIAPAIGILAALIPRRLATSRSQPTPVSK
jgi:hypothetical protein